MTTTTGISMLRITVELFPGGFEPLRRPIATMDIGNVSDLAEISNYAVRATEGANHLTGTPPRHFEAEVKGHDRRQSVWRLVAVAAAAVADAASSRAGE